MVRRILIFPFLLPFLLCFLNPFKLLVPAQEQHDRPSAHEEKQLLPVQLIFQFSYDHISKFEDLQWEVRWEGEESGDHVLISSNSSPSKRYSIDPENDHGCVVVMFNFALISDKVYKLILKYDLKQDAGSKKSKVVYPNEEDQKTMAHVNATILYEDFVLMSGGGLPIDGHTTHVLPFHTAVIASSENRRWLVDSPTYSGPNRKTLPPYTLQPRPPKPPQTPLPPQTPSPNPASQPAPQQEPQLAPQQGEDEGDQGTSSSPSWSGGTKPPSFYANITSSAPTIDAPCLSTTNGPVPFEEKYIAIQINVPQSIFSNNNSTDTILADIIDAYNAVAICDQKSALRIIDRAFLFRVNGEMSDDHDSNVLEWIVQLSGVCDGCIDGAEAAFTVSPTINQEESSNSSSTQSVTDLQWVDVNETMTQSKPCFCPGPLISTFQDKLNEIMEQHSNLTKTPLNVLSAVELENAAACNPLLQDDDIPPQQYNTLVALILAEDSSAMAATDLQSLFVHFKDVVHSHLSLTYPTCDLSRKRILDIQRGSNDQTILGRKLRRPPSADIRNHQRKVQRSSANFELVLNITFTCFGCEGRLFGTTNFTPGFDCLCPIVNEKFGVEEKEILIALNDAMNLQHISQPVLDVIEIEVVPCSSTLNEFSTVVVIEYMLKSNETVPSDDDLVILEEEFVAGYNGMARRYCDPYFRHISSAKTLPNYEISRDGLKLNVEMSIVGTCRGNCTSDFSIYDTSAFFNGLDITGVTTDVSSNRTRSMLGIQSRQLQMGMELDSTCYCNKAASKVLGPSEPEIVQNFGDLVETLSLESIREVTECRPFRFRTGIILTVPDYVANATQDELDQIGQTFVDTYNQQSQQDGFCDEYFRMILDYHVSSIPTRDDGFNEIPIMDGEVQTPNGRKLLTRLSYHPKRGLQATETVPPSFAPSLTPTISWDNYTSAPVLTVPVSRSTSIFLDVLGFCQGCSKDTGLFDQVSAHRQLQQDRKIELVENNSSTTVNIGESCFCPPNSMRIEISDDSVITAVSSLPFVNGSVGLSEVDLVDCSVEVNTFETTVPLDFLVQGDIVQGDEDYIANGFMTTYIGLSDDYCDSMLRRPEQVLSSTPQVSSGPDQNGVSKVRFFLVLQATCHGCTGSESLFDTNRRRIQEEDICYCNGNSRSGAPTAEEFQEAFKKYLGSRRRLQQQNKFTLLCVGSTCPVASTDVPSLSPTSVILRNPGGIQNFPGCIVLNSSFVGDGYCDRTLDVNGEPIYNNAACGYDGGDCCESTCQGFTQECGTGGYWCLDPNAESAPNNNLVTDPCAEQAGAFLGNGQCDLELNIPFCNYDEGDCCESTCGILNGMTCSRPFPNCMDPTASMNAPSTSPSGMPSIEPYLTPLTKICRANPACDADSSFFCGDGWCDEELNTEECGWDGGDCCFETCSNDETSDFPCGSGGFQCKDPDNARQFPEGCKADVPEWVGDGICDKWGYYNTPSCDYDGGDCCKEDCKFGPCHPESFMCFKGCPAELTFLLGDGYCDAEIPYNSPECQWDFGDCCPDTCKSSALYVCGLTSQYSCHNHESNFSSTKPPIPTGCVVDNASLLGDGQCDDYGNYNTAMCDWDFGDCCLTSCQAATWFQPYACDTTLASSKILSCKDPNRSIRPVQPSKDCLLLVSGANAEKLGDGSCDIYGDFNTAECKWDFGDCCESTCIKTPGSSDPFQCYKYFFDCLDPLVNSPPPTPTGSQQVELVWNPNLFSWLVRDFASGIYRDSVLDTLFGQPVYLKGEFMLYWCKSESHWTIQQEADVAKIARYGCKGQGFASNKVDDPTNLCNAVWTINEIPAIKVVTEKCPFLTPTPTFRGPRIKVLGNDNLSFSSTTGIYEPSEDSVYNVSIYKKNDFPIIYWCQPQSRWFFSQIHGDGDYAYIPLNGCAGLPSDQVSGPEVSFCDFNWTKPARFRKEFYIKVYTDECPLVPPPPPVTPGPDVQIVPNPYYSHVARYAGLYVGSETESLYGVSVYSNGADMIYWCESMSRWYINEILDVQVILYLGVCLGLPSATVFDGPGKLCKASWDDLLLFSEDCDNKIPNTPPTRSPSMVLPPVVTVLRDPSYQNFGSRIVYGGSYVLSPTDSIYGVGVYYEGRGRGMLSWCEPEQTWQLSVIVPDPQSILYFGCKGFLASSKFDSPEQICDVVWSDNDNTTMFSLRTNDCFVNVPRPSIPNFCVVPNENLLGDGKCDGGDYNTFNCSWDMGDCCDKSCETAAWFHEFPCGSSGYECLDPSVLQRPQVPRGCEVDHEEYLGDGACDGGVYNTLECDWDFGDCCKRSCESTLWYKQYKCGILGYSCQDPSLPHRPPIPSGCIVDSEENLGDGVCHIGGSYNTKACGWDMGDCCEGSCKAAAWFERDECGSSGYYCLDPSLSLQRPPVPIDCVVDFPKLLGDGNCNGGNYSTEACAWDFGDCCPETCESAQWYHPYPCGFGGYNCTTGATVVGTALVPGLSSFFPSSAPSMEALSSPSAVPSALPSKLASVLPSAVLPSVLPSAASSKSPSMVPSQVPSGSQFPSYVPSEKPSLPP